jgi:hypothetical protein
VDQDLRAYLEGMEARIGERFERVETEARHTRILVEGLSSDLRLLGEGVMGVSERLDAYQAETARSFDEVKSMLSPYYRDLNGRAQSLESDVRCLDSRLKVLEGRADRQTEDVLVAIRKKFGKPQS